MKILPAFALSALTGLWLASSFAARFAARLERHMAVENSQIALRLPVTLRAEIERAAAAERRSLANMLRVLITAGIEARRTPQTSRAEVRA